MIVALDGPAGVGKSTIARKIAERKGFMYLNSGNFYRAITVAVQEKGADAAGDIIRAAEESHVEIIRGRFVLNGRDVHDQLHSDLIDSKVAQISAVPEIRAIVNRMLREVASGLDCVMEGRDIGTVVFPEAEVKIFLDASVKTRAQRRFDQGVSSLNRELIEKAIQERDYIDRNKKHGALKMAGDSIYLDTSDLTIDQVCEKVLAKIDTYRHGLRS